MPKVKKRSVVELRQLAKQKYADGSDDNIEVDYDGKVHRDCTDGAWVQAWVWVPDDYLGK